MKFSKINESERRYITSGIRKAFTRGPLYQAVLDEYRVEEPRILKSGNLSTLPNVFYRCNKCNTNFKRKEIQVDHIETVIPLDSSLDQMTIGQYARRVFNNKCQVLCRYCHKEKTAEENAVRKKERGIRLQKLALELLEKE